MSYPNRGLSIDIGNDKIKIVEYRKKKDKIRINKALMLETPDNCLEDGTVTDVPALAERISEALKEKKVKEKNVVFTVASSKIITREVDLPDLPKKKLQSLIDMNAEEYFPVDLSEYTTDYRILDHFEEEENKMIRVNMVAGLTSVMESYIALADTMKLKIAGIDYAGNSIVNFANISGNQSTYLLLDIGNSSTMVTIMNQGNVRFNRSLVYGSQVVLNSIQNHFGVQRKEAMKISVDQQLLTTETESDDFLSNDVTAALNQVLSGVSRLVDFYTSRNKEGIEHIYLVGGGTRINGIRDYVAAYFNIDAEVIKSLDNVTAMDEAYTSDAEFFANAVGAIQSEMNMIPKSYLDRNKQRSALRVRLEIGVLLAALIGVALYLPYMNIQELKKEKADLEAEIEAKKIVIPIKEAYTSIMARKTFFDGVEGATASTTENVRAVIEVMEKEIPSEVDYLSINNTEDSMMISCIASDKATIAKFLTILKDIERNNQKIFSKVFIPGFGNSIDGANAETTAEGQEDGYYTFSIICDYNKEAK